MWIKCGTHRRIHMSKTRRKSSFRHTHMLREKLRSVRKDLFTQIGNIRMLVVRIISFFSKIYKADHFNVQSIFQKQGFFHFSL